MYFTLFSIIIKVYDVLCTQMFEENTKRVFHNRCEIFAREQDVPYGWIQKFFPLDFCKNVLNFYMGHPVVVHLDILLSNQAIHMRHETPCCCTSRHFNFFVWDTLYQYMQILQSQSINPYETPCSCTSRHFKVNQSFHSELEMEQ